MDDQMTGASSAALELALRILTFDTLPSTQDEMRRRLAAGETVHGLVVRAAQQTRGRGQRARDWQSGLGGSYQTVAVRDTVPLSLNRPHAALVVALGLAETLPRYGVKVRLKWPNDLFYRQKKLAGVLAELVQGHLLVGVGVNVENPTPAGAVGLRGWDLDGVHAVVLEGVQRGLGHLLQPDFELPAAYAPFDLLAGGEVGLETPTGTFTGVASGVDASGRLLIAGNGGVRAFASGRLRNFTLSELKP